MNILLVHNSYQNHGGEDVVFHNERDLLMSAGHRVSTYTRTNDEINEYGWLRRASLAPRTVWAWDSLEQMRELIANEHPDIVHFHNTFPLVSPSAYFACKEAGVPVVQTLHNSRFVCPAATFSRDGNVCEDCLDKKIPWPSVLHGCYRNSRLQSAVVAGMLAAHRRLKTWERLVDQFIAPTQLFAGKFAAAGLPASKMSIKPHFVDRTFQHVKSKREYALFVGRLVPEKGVFTMLHAWECVRGAPLKIRGDGPLLSYVQKRVAERKGAVEWLARPGREGLIRLIQNARFLVWPSEGLYENFGLVAVEAFACGVPVIASNAGVMAETVRDGHTGLHFTVGSTQDLAAKVEWAWTHPAEMEEMGVAARAEYEEMYTPERNYKMLMHIYQFAIADRQRLNSDSQAGDLSVQ